GIRDFHVTGVQTCALPISFLVELVELVRLLLARRCRVTINAMFNSSSGNAAIWRADRDEPSRRPVGGAVFFPASDGLELCSDVRSEERRVGEGWGGGVCA